MLLAALLLQGSFAGTVPTDSTAYELTSLFYLTCVRQLPLRADARYRMELPSYRMTEATAEDRSDIALGGVSQAWTAKSRHDGAALLWLSPANRTCGVDIRAADRQATETTFTELLKFYYHQPDFAVEERPPTMSRETNGETSTLRSWVVNVGGHRLLVQGAFANAPVHGFQHKMTITLVN